MNNTYYVPFDVNSNACYEVIDRHTLRAYKTQPTYNQNIQYFDIYLDEHYNTSGINTAWYWYNNEGSHATLPTCYNKNLITNDVFYRNDLSDILIIFIIIVIFVSYFPLKLFKTFRKRAR